MLLMYLFFTTIFVMDQWLILFIRLVSCIFGSFFPVLGIKNIPNWYFPVLGFRNETFTTFDFRGSPSVVVIEIAYFKETESFSFSSLVNFTSIFFLFCVLILAVYDWCFPFILHSSSRKFSTQFMVFCYSLWYWYNWITSSVILSIWVFRAWLYLRSDPLLFSSCLEKEGKIEVLHVWPKNIPLQHSIIST